MPSLSEQQGELKRKKLTKALKRLGFSINGGWKLEISAKSGSAFGGRG